MADLNLRYLTYLKGLRDTQFAGHPTQALDSASILKLDEPTVRGNVAATSNDYNTFYYLVVP